MPDPNDPATYLAGLGIKPTAGGTTAKSAATGTPPPPAGWVEVMPGIAYNPNFSLDKAGSGTMVRYFGPDIGWTTAVKATPDVIAAAKGGTTTQPQQAATATKPGPIAATGSQIMQTPLNKAGNSTAFQTPANYIPGPSGFTGQGPFGPESAGPYNIQTAGGPILGVSTGGISHPGDMSHGLNYERILADTYGGGRPWTSGDQATDAVMAANVERARNFANGPVVAPAPQSVVDPMARPSVPMAQSPLGQAIGMGAPIGTQGAMGAGLGAGGPSPVTGQVAQSFQNSGQPVVVNGTTLSPQVVAAVQQAWPAELVPQALAIVARESGGRPEVDNGHMNADPKYGNAGTPYENSTDYGLFGINNTNFANLGLTPETARNPTANAAAAYDLYQRAGGFSPWTGNGTIPLPPPATLPGQITGQAVQGFDNTPTTNPVVLPGTPPTIPVAPITPQPGGGGGGGSWGPPPTIGSLTAQPPESSGLGGGNGGGGAWGGTSTGIMAPSSLVAPFSSGLIAPFDPMRPTQSPYSPQTPQQIALGGSSPAHPYPGGGLIVPQPSALNPQGPFARTSSSFSVNPPNGTSSQFPTALTSGPIPSNPLANNGPAPSFFDQARAMAGNNVPSTNPTQPSFLDQARQVGAANSAAAGAMAGIGAGAPPPLSAPLIPPAPQARTQGQPTVPGVAASAFTPVPTPAPQNLRTPPPPDFSGATSPNYGSTGLYQSPLSGGLENVFRTDAGYVFSPGRINETESLRSPMGGNTPLMTPSGVVIQHPEDMTPAAQTQLAMANGLPNIGQTSNPGAAYAAAQFAGPNATNLNNLGFASAANLPPAATLVGVAQAEQDKAAADAAAAAQAGGMMGDNGGTRFMATGGTFMEDPRGPGGISFSGGGGIGGGNRVGNPPPYVPAGQSPSMRDVQQMISQSRGSGMRVGAPSDPYGPSTVAMQQWGDPMRGYAKGGTFLTTQPTMFPMASGGQAVTSEYGQPEKIHTSPVPGGRVQVHVTPMHGYAAGGTFDTTADPTASVAAPSTTGTLANWGGRTPMNQGPTDPMAPVAPSDPTPPIANLDPTNPAAPQNPTNQDYTSPPAGPTPPAPIPTIAPSAFQQGLDTNPELGISTTLANRQFARDTQGYLRRAAGVPDPIGISSQTPLTGLAPNQYWAPIDYTNQIQGLQSRLAALGPVTGDPTQLAFDLQAAQNGYGGNGPGQPGWINPDPVRAAQIQQQLSNMTTAADLMNQIANLRANQPSVTGYQTAAYNAPPATPVTLTIPTKQNPNLALFLSALGDQSNTNGRRDPMKVAA